MVGRLCSNKVNIHARTQLLWAMHSDGRDFDPIAEQNWKTLPYYWHSGIYKWKLLDCLGVDRLRCSLRSPEESAVCVHAVAGVYTTYVGHSHCFPQINRKHRHVFSRFVLQCSDNSSLRSFSWWFPSTGFSVSFHFPI